MCSVVGCESWRRGAHRFNLPQDPDERLEWIQFLFEINGQRLKESSWTDITICIEHFTDDCFENVSTTPATVQLKSRAVPSLCVKSEPQEPQEPQGPQGPQEPQEPQEPDQARPKHEETVQIEVTEDASQCDQLSTHESPSSSSEESEPTSYAAQGSPTPSDNSDTSMYDYGQMLQKVENIDIIRDKVSLLQIKGNYAVNENRLIPLFAHKCPLCDSKVKVEKLTYGVLIILNKQCIQCEYKDQWKSQVNARVPTDEDRHLTGGIDVTPETQQTESTDDDSSTVTGVLEYVAYDNPLVSDSMDEEEDSANEGDMISDEDWSPTDEVLLEDDERSESDDYDDLPKHTQLCVECGMLYNEHRPHTCEHKIKPYSCNVCGKRCVSEVALNCHSRVHDENYEHRCKYCHVVFKTKVDKHKHEQTHLTQEKPYKCPDCSETFSTNKKRKIHLEGHRGPRQLKCNFCGIEFYRLVSLRRHLPVHTGVKPYKCSVCQRSFNQASHLKSHMHLHTGERPYKCQQCDKSFNHNVSLKSHVQRFHSSSSGCEQKKNKIREKASDTDDVKENGNKIDIICESDSVEEEQVVEKEAQKLRRERPQSRKRSSGRPKGRPKRNAAGNLVLAGKNDGPASKSKTPKSKVQKLKKTGSSDEESEDSDISFHSAEEEEEEEGEKQPVSKNTGRSRSRQNNESDSDFDPGEEAKKKRYSSQSSSKSSGKSRSRPRKNVAV